ncbi:regucalcin-like isoform X2 [Ornithodoros turicata]|uniref:regucalcin-like isoform X2 n=1 Tax=Ornithodoros turicata TaxID=34597 RepID=UPI003138C980
MSVSVVSKRRSNLGEGPHWDYTSNTLLHVDPHLWDVCRLNVLSRETDTVHLDGLVTIVIPYNSNPDLNVITVGRQIRKLDWTTKKTEVLAEVDQDRPTNHFNDGKCDVTGRLWAGTRGEERGPDDIDPEKGTLYSFDPPGMQPKGHVHKISISNGMTWSPDNKKMFYIDSFTRIIYSFDFNAATGELTNQQVFLDFNKDEAYKDKGYPDGMTHDVEGKLWVACYDASRVIRIDPETGKLLREVTFPATKITSCCFGGPNYDELYVTSAWRGLSDEERKAQPDAGAVFRVTQLGTRGFQPNTLNL